MWWNGIPLPYEKADRFSGLKDKNNRMLYEGDVVSIPFPNEPEVFKNMLISFEDGQCILSEVSGMVRIEISDMDRISGIVFLGFAFEDGLI